MMNEAAAKVALSFPPYVAKTVLYQLDEDPGWPQKVGPDDN